MAGIAHYSTDYMGKLYVCVCVCVCKYIGWGNPMARLTKGILYNIKKLINVC